MNEVENQNNESEVAVNKILNIASPIAAGIGTALSLKTYTDAKSAADLVSALKTASK